MADSGIPIWAYTAWWNENTPDTKEYRQRYADFLNMVKESGRPVIITDRDHNPVAVEFAGSDAGCETTRNFGGPTSRNDIRIVCRFCGQEKDQFLEFCRAVAARRTHPGTNTSGLIRVVDPRFLRSAAGLVDTPNSVWAKCPHVAAWKPAGTK